MRAPRVAVITGATRGIGLATRAALDADGWITINHSRSTHVDAADLDAVAAAWRTVARFSAEQGPVRALVCCAGTVEPEPLVDTAPETFAHQVAVNLTGTFAALREFARRATPPAAAVLVSSTAASRPAPGWAAYAASKAGVESLVATADAELAPKGIRVYGVAPGRCATELRRTLAPGEDPASIMQPAEVAGVVRALLADTDRVLAGQVIRVAR